MAVIEEEVEVVVEAGLEVGKKKGVAGGEEIENNSNHQCKDQLFGRRLQKVKTKSNVFVPIEYGLSDENILLM